MLRAAAELKLKSRSSQSAPAKATDLLHPVMAYERLRPEVVYLRGLSSLRAQGLGGGRRVPENHRSQGCRLGSLEPRLRAIPPEPKRTDQDFLALWKDADPDIPVFTEATKEYAA
jgi:hypothetical protein